MRKPLVSIIIPVYNVESYIEECLESVINQTYRPLEVVLVDDKGCDRSMDLVFDFVNSVKDKSILFSIFHHGVNRGLSVARNTGTKYAKGEYIVYLDSDDQLAPSMIELSIASLLLKNADFTICDFFSDKQNDKRGGHLLSSDSVLTGVEALESFNKGLIGVSAWGKLIKKKFLEKNRIRFVEGIINEDEPWFFNMLLCADKIVLVHEPLYYYRYNESSIMSSLKMDRLILSNEVIVRDFLKTIISDDKFIYNKNVYLAYMRVLVLYYSRLVQHDKVLPNFKNFKYNAKWFAVFSKSIPIYYRLWNLAFYIPKCFLRFYLLTIIKLQTLK